MCRALYRYAWIKTGTRAAIRFSPSRRARRLGRHLSGRGGVDAARWTGEDMSVLFLCLDRLLCVDQQTCRIKSLF